MSLASLILGILACLFALLPIFRAADNNASGSRRHPSRIHNYRPPRQRQRRPRQTDGNRRSGALNRLFADYGRQYGCSMVAACLAGHFLRQNVFDIRLEFFQ